MRAHLAAIGCNGQEISRAHLAAIGCNGLTALSKLTSNDLPGASEIHQGLGPYGPGCSYTTAVNKLSIIDRKIFALKIIRILNF